MRVKFRIYPDGRVEETVSGIRGSDCTKVTEELNEKLGKKDGKDPCFFHHHLGNCRFGAGDCKTGFH